MKSKVAVHGILVLFVLCCSIPAFAEQYAARDLTTEAGSLDLYIGPVPRPLIEDGGFHFHPKGKDLDFDLGGSFGITENIEIGAYVLQTRLLDKSEIDNPYLWATFEIVSGSTEVGVRPIVPIPIFDSEFWLGLGLPVLVHLSHDVRLETGVQLRLTFSDPLGVDAFVPLRLAFNITPVFFLGLDTGVAVPLAPENRISVPFGFFLGFTVADGVDIGAAFRWGELFRSERDPVFFGGDPEITLGVNLYGLL